MSLHKPVTFNAKRVALAVPAVALAATSMLAAPAEAHTVDNGASATASKSLKSKKKNRPDVIVCQVKMNNPHNSHHVRGTINAQATVKCTKPVSGMKLRVKLLKNGKVRKTSLWKVNNGKSSIKQNAALTCQPKKRWQAIAEVWVWFPPKYIPAAGSSTVRSAVRTIQKCN
ncbi:hypothetical protein [Actinomadura sp. 6N118]|uniref:hypothetical protein n=1 Tax=Actinomadura sp. 6N118 TaxID=3375151 RepID=UPI00378E5F5B